MIFTDTAEDNIEIDSAKDDKSESRTITVIENSNSKDIDKVLDSIEKSIESISDIQKGLTELLGRIERNKIINKEDKSKKATTTSSGKYNGSKKEYNTPL